MAVNLAETNATVTGISGRFIGILLLACAFKWFIDYRKTPKVPGVGYDIYPLLRSWRAAFRFMLQPKELMNRGYERYKSGYFRISTIQHEHVVVPSSEKIQEYLRAKDDVLNFQDGANDALQIPWTMGYGVGHRTYHVPLIRVNLTQSIKHHIDEMREQISDALGKRIGRPTEYQEFAIYDIIAYTVARVSNRVFSGPDLCHNEEYLDNAIKYATDVVISAEIIRLLPNWLKPIAVNFTPVKKRRRLAIKWLGPVVQERLDAVYEKESDKPNDLIQWLVDTAPPVEKTVPQLVERIMALNVASIHTTTMTFTSGLYCLAEEPETYLPALREEVIEHCKDVPVTKDTLGKLVKMDSFLREAGRFNSTSLIGLARTARKKFIFEDGTVIPAGAKVGAPLYNLHNDPRIYENPEVFDGFRFSRLREKSQGALRAAKHQMVTTELDYLPFGHGKHACPGRFFAVNEMKLIFIYLLLNYEMKLIPGTRPARNRFLGTMGVPETELKILIRAWN